MTYVLPFLALFFGAATTDPETRAEQVMSGVAKESIPPCERGHSRALARGVLTIRPGETVCLSFRAEGSALSPLSVVDVAGQESTLVVRFWREENTGDMFLALYNPFPNYLQYQATMLLSGSSQHQHTSTCPVLSGHRNVESWNIPVTELRLSAFKLLPDSESVACQ